MTTQSRSLPRSELAKTNPCLKIIQDFKKLKYESFVSGYFTLEVGSEACLFKDLRLALNSLLTKTYDLVSDKDEITNVVELSRFFNEILTHFRQYLDNCSFESAEDVKHTLNVVENALVRKFNHVTELRN